LQVTEEALMSTNVLFYAWRGVKPGREKIAAGMFREFLEYTGALKANGKIESAEPVLLAPNGSTVQGFFLIKASAQALDELQASEDFLRHQTMGVMNLDSPLVTRGASGDLVGQMMQLWASVIP
jgi:hypothetical protein